MTALSTGLHIELLLDVEVPAPTPGGFIAHMGIQLKSTDQIAEAKERYLAAGFHIEEEVAKACCYAVQNKIWIGDPDGNRWELFVTTDNDRNELCEGVPDCSKCSCYDEIAPNRGWRGHRVRAGHPSSRSGHGHRFALLRGGSRGDHLHLDSAQHRMPPGLPAGGTG